MFRRHVPEELKDRKATELAISSAVAPDLNAVRLESLSHSARYELIIVWVQQVSAAGVKSRVRIRIPVLHVNLDVDERLCYGLEIDQELAVAQTIDRVA